MSELSHYVVQGSFWKPCDMPVMYVMREIEDSVLDIPIISTSAYDKFFEKFRAALLTWQHYYPQLVEVYQR